MKAAQSRKDRRGRRKAISLHQRLPRVISGTFIVALLLAFVAVSFFIYRAEHETWQTRQRDAAHSAARTIANFTDGVRNYLTILSTLDLDYLAQNAGTLTTILQKNEALVELIRLDAEGNVIASTYKDTEPILTNRFTIAQSTWFQQAREGRPYTGDIQLAANNEPYLILAIPTPDGGVLGARLLMHVLWDVVAGISFGQSGQAYIVDAQGNVIAHRDPAIVLSRTTILDRPEFQFVLNSDRQESYGAYQSFEGNRVMGFATQIPGSDWWVITEINRHEAFSTLRHATFTLGAGLVAFTLITSSIVHVMLRRLILNPLERLRAGVERVGQGDLAYRLDSERADELGQVAATFSEMTARLQQRENALAQARDEALAASRFKSRLLANVSHDLRTPLNGILGYTDMLKEEVFGPLSPQQASTVDRILVNTQRLLATINSLLDQARIEADELKLHHAPFDPADLLHDVEKIMGSLAESKGLAFHTALDEELPNPIIGDRQRIHQIVMNLVDNALKFTDGGEINVRFGAAGLAWTIEVQDTGRGIPQEKQNQLFAPFYQIDNSTTREQGGVGLGLAIVRQLAKAMGGEVLLASEVGEGSTFMVMLPITPIQQEVSQQEEPIV